MSFFKNVKWQKGIFLQQVKLYATVYHLFGTMDEYILIGMKFLWAVFIEHDRIHRLDVFVAEFVFSVCSVPPVIRFTAV